MKLQSFETGVQRLYYAAWALVFFIALWVNYILLSRDSLISDAELMEAGFNVMACLIGPWIAMHVIRWIYRGFVPAR